MHSSQITIVANHELSDQHSAWRKLRFTHLTQAVLVQGVNEAVEIKHDDQDDRGAFVIERDGKRIAEQTYKWLGANHIDIVHTEVDADLREQGLARRLFDALIAWARAAGIRVSATCPYVRKQFARDASLRDVMTERRS